MNGRCGKSAALLVHVVEGQVRRKRPPVVAFSLSSVSGSSSHGNEKSQASKNQYMRKRNVCVLAPSEFDDDTFAFQRQAQDLASRLFLPLLSQDELDENAIDFTLSLEPYRYMNIDSYAISIQSVNDSSGKKKEQVKRKKTKKGSGNVKPFSVDLCPNSNTKMGRRLSEGGQKGGELLLKATALGRNKGSTVYDLTAGLAQDSCIMALGGASSVHMVEKDPIVATLLEDAFRRLQLVADTCKGKSENDDIPSRAVELLSKLSLEQDDAIDVAKRLSKVSDTSSSRPDICYLDPMFPPRTKSAAVKKNMNVLHGLLETQSQYDTCEIRERNEADLLLAALAAARRKVVVKRPIQAPPLGGDMVKKKPSSIIRGSVNRWDVYVV